MGRRALVARQQSWMPRLSAPSTSRWAPVVKADAGLLRKTTARAISWGVPIRPVGFWASWDAYRSGMFRSAPCQKPSSKYVLPGDTAFARTPRPASWNASPLM
jgi:hypothetical protein